VTRPASRSVEQHEHVLSDRRHRPHHADTTPPTADWSEPGQRSPLRNEVRSPPSGSQPSKSCYMTTARLRWNSTAEEQAAASNSMQGATSAESVQVDLCMVTVNFYKYVRKLSLFADEIHLLSKLHCKSKNKTPY